MRGPEDPAGAIRVVGSGPDAWKWALAGSAGSREG